MCLPHHQLVLRWNDTVYGLTNSIRANIMGSSHGSVIVREGLLGDHNLIPYNHSKNRLVWRDIEYYKRFECVFLITNWFWDRMSWLTVRPTSFFIKKRKKKITPTSKNLDQPSFRFLEMLLPQTSQTWLSLEDYIYTINKFFFFFIRQLSNIIFYLNKYIFITYLYKYEEKCRFIHSLDKKFLLFY